MTRVLLFFIFIFVSCKSHYGNDKSLGGDYPLPPNCYPISENFFADFGEISNISYIYFQGWTEKVFGSDSREYKATLLDTTVWNEMEGLAFLSEGYHWKSKFFYNPVVGINLEQAKAFTEWRTNVSAEMILVKKGYMLPNHGQNRESYFTVEKFLNGEYKYPRGRKKINPATFELTYPVFKIPNAKEWESISGVDSDNLAEIFPANRYNKRILKDYPYPFNTIEFHKSNFNSFTSYDGTLNIKVITAHVRDFGRNKYGLHGIIGNVSEMIEEEGFSKGENWNSSFQDFSKEKNNEFLKPNCWTGFRNVCSWKKGKFVKK